MFVMMDAVQLQTQPIEISGLRASGFWPPARPTPARTSRDTAFVPWRTLRGFQTITTRDKEAYVNVSRMFWGGLLIVGGLVFLGDSLSLWDGEDVVATWWPLVIIVAAALSAMSRPPRLFGPVILGLIGVALLVDRLEVVQIEAGIVWPIILIAVGVSFLIRRVPSDLGDEAHVRAFTAFGGTEVASHSAAFEGGHIGSVFGGTELDLRDAHLAPNASLDVFTAFGGTEIKVPKGWKVKTHGLPLFGGFENVTTGETLAPDAPTLDVSATVLFGGLEVKH